MQQIIEIRVGEKHRQTVESGGSEREDVEKSERDIYRLYHTKREGENAREDVHQSENEREELYKVVIENESGDKESR